MKAYKILREQNIFRRIKGERYISATNLGTPITYKTGEWVSRPDGAGPICVFDDLYDAIIKADFWGGNLVIFECEYVASKDDKIWARNRQSKADELRLLPHHTILVDRVKLTKLIYRSKRI